MSSGKNGKKAPWKNSVFIISVLFIVFLWIKKDIVTIYTTMPSQQVLPLIATSIAVSVIKMAAIAGALFLVKWMVSKIKKK